PRDFLGITTGVPEKATDPSRRSTQQPWACVDGGWLMLAHVRPGGEDHVKGIFRGATNPAESPALITSGEFPLPGCSQSPVVKSFTSSSKSNRSCTSCFAALAIAAARSSSFG